MTGKGHKIAQSFLNIIRVYNVGHLSLYLLIYDMYYDKEKVKRTKSEIKMHCHLVYLPENFKLPYCGLRCDVHFHTNHLWKST